jgi:DNA-binding winged helix-turn-helix (wHTH) protein
MTPIYQYQLLERVWPGLIVEENNLQVQVSALRKLLGQDAIATVAGRGYRFTLESAKVEAPLPS